MTGRLDWALAEPTSADWILGGLTALDAYNPDVGSPLSCLLPAGFDGYVKILDVVVERADGGKSLSDEVGSDADLPTLVPSLGSRKAGRPERGVRKTTWRELSARLGLTLHPEFEPNCVNEAIRSESAQLTIEIPVKEGTLSEETFLGLLECFRRQSPNAEFFFHWDLLKMLHAGSDSAYTLVGPGDTLPSNWPRMLDFTPSYVWPTDRSWILATDYDLSFSVVACGRDLADALLRHARIETIEMTLSHRIDRNADSINRHQ